MSDIIRDNLQGTNPKQPMLVHDIIYKSKSMDKILKDITKIAPNNVTVLITGETGTGKELIARAIHENSPRKDKAFIKIDCGAIPENLIESELFGHEKGAFTGAVNGKKGKFEAADSGTLFLDEVGNLSSSAQIRLLRVLQEREFERMGGSETIRVDVRLITATNRDLEQDISNGKFMKDLYFRINVVPIHLPPLNERREDIPYLVTHFREKYNKKHGVSKDVEKQVIDVLMGRVWEGNIRELENYIERLIILSRGDSITIEDLKVNDLTPLQPGVIKAKPDIENPPAQKYRQLCDWILKDEKYLLGSQCKESFKAEAKRLGIWQTDDDTGKIGRKLISVISRNEEIFRGLKKEEIKSIFDLLFKFAPSFEKEKAAAIDKILMEWSNNKAYILLEYPLKDDLFISGLECDSPPFYITSAKIAIQTKVWPGSEPSKTILHLKKYIDAFLGELEGNDEYAKIEILAGSEEDSKENLNVIPINKSGIYYLTVCSTSRYEVKIFELNKHDAL